MIVEGEMRVAVVGLGAIGRRVVEALDRGLDGLVLAAISLQEPGKHRDFLATLSRAPAILPIESLSGVADVVIECAPSALLKSIVLPFVSKVFFRVNRVRNPPIVDPTTLVQLFPHLRNDGAQRFQQRGFVLIDLRRQRGDDDRNRLVLVT